jgi:hypothetical protein
LAINTLRDVGLTVHTAAALLGSPLEAIAEAITPLDVALTIFVSSVDVAES